MQAAAASATPGTGQRRTSFAIWEAAIPDVVRAPTSVRASENQEMGVREKNIRVGIDVGGTFTDFVLIDGQSGKVSFGKELTTHDDPSRAMLAGLEKMLAANQLQFSDLTHVVHA